MSDSVIKVNNASKKFCKSLKKSMLYGAIDVTGYGVGLTPDTSRLRKDEFWAVNDVSFELKKGSTLGLIGPNGSGKSTMLKMLNGIFMPDKGTIEISGKVGALIEVGAGFHPMLTGRENIYINGSILGMKKRDIDERFDEIVFFADIGDFIDAPVKHYSSGMYVRLGFSIAVHSEPDILLVDEILAVGDRDFSIKCYQKIHDLQKKGAAIVLVSHNEHLIRERTEKCVYLSSGEMKYYGNSDDCINIYIKDSLARKKMHIKNKESQYLSKKAEIVKVSFMDKDLNEINEIETGGELNIKFEFIVHESLNKPILGVNFYGEDNFMYCANSEYEGIDLSGIKMGGNTLIINILQMHLPINKYSCSAVIAEDNATNLLDWHDMVYTLTMLRPANTRGALKFPTKWGME